MRFKSAVKLPSSSRPFINGDTSYDESVLVKLLFESSAKRLPKSTKIITCRMELPPLPENAIPNQDMLIAKPYFITVGDLQKMYRHSHPGTDFIPENYRNI